MLELLGIFFLNTNNAGMVFYGGGIIFLQFQAVNCLVKHINFLRNRVILFRNQRSNKLKNGQFFYVDGKYTFILSYV